MNWKQETEGLIDIIEIYYKKGGWSELPNEVINDIEGTLEEQTEEIERLNKQIKEVINYIDDNTYYKDHKGHINIDDLYIILQKGSDKE